jgi:hypothetical protein
MSVEALAHEVHLMLLHAVEKRCAEICKERGYATPEESKAAGLTIEQGTGSVNGVDTLSFRIMLNGKPVSGWIHAVFKRDTDDEWIVQIREL